MEGQRNINNPRQQVNFSKALSKLLRHQALNEGLEIRPDGFIRLNDVLAVKWIAKFKPTMYDVQDIVESNNKKRFELQKDEQFPDIWLIRAVQGHSIAAVSDEALLTPIGKDLSKTPNIF
jgi:2'-phosphotransferase